MSTLTQAKRRRGTARASITRLKRDIITLEGKSVLTPMIVCVQALPCFPGFLYLDLFITVLYIALFYSFKVLTV